MSKEIELNLDKPNELFLVAKSLASEIRIEILRLLCFSSLNVNEISEKLNLPPSTAALHVRILEEVGLIHTELQPGVRGSMKLCSKQKDYISATLLTEQMAFLSKIEYIDMPIGNYIDCLVEPTCGLASEKTFIGEEDNKSVFYSPLRTTAKIIWLSKGYLEYRFPNTSIQSNYPKSVEISAELCSEAPNYRLDWKSDITLWVNGFECGTWRCPSDFGGRRGRLNPSWWSDCLTQYGILKTWTINANGVYLDGCKVSNTTINEIDLLKYHYISVRLGNKDDAKYKGGLNIFGDSFGDYAQNIVMKIVP